jgi:hypothetical protein
VNDKSCVEVARLLDVQFETVKEEVATVSGGLEPNKQCACFNI